MATPQQLLLIKELYDDACILAARDDRLSLTKAVLLLDLSVEQILNQVLHDFDRDSLRQSTEGEPTLSGEAYGSEPNR